MTRQEKRTAIKTALADPVVENMLVICGLLKQLPAADRMRVMARVKDLLDNASDMKLKLVEKHP